MTSPPFEKDRLLLGLQRVMEKLVEAAAELGVVLPARRVVAAAAVPFDCEEVLTYAVTIRTGSPESRSGVGTYPNQGANVTMYTLSAMLVIVRNTATLPGSPAEGVGTSPPEPASYLTNLTSASSDTAALLFAAAKVQAEDVMAGTGAVTEQVTFSAPSGGLFASTCAIQTII